MRSSLRLAVLLAPALLAASGCDTERNDQLSPSPLPDGRSTQPLTQPALRTPTTFPLASAGFERGDSRAPITIYEISDFGCRYCGLFARDEFPSLRDEFIDRGRVRWVFIPTEGASANGAQAARAAVCAGEQGLFWEVHDRLFHDQRGWMRPRDPEPVLTALATAAGVEPRAFSECYRDEETVRRLQRSSRISLLVGVRATPSFFVDGRIVEGALSSTQFGDLIRRLEALAATGDGS
jgi:protein-disulfide isomerase